jgi:hypothetical protein
MTQEDLKDLNKESYEARGEEVSQAIEEVETLVGMEEIEIF